MKELFPESWLLAHLTSMYMSGLNTIGYTIKMQVIADAQRAQAEYRAAAQRREFEFLITNRPL